MSHIKTYDKADKVKERVERYSKNVRMDLDGNESRTVDALNGDIEKVKKGLEEEVRKRREAIEKKEHEKKIPLSIEAEIDQRFETKIKRKLLKDCLDPSSGKFVPIIDLTYDPYRRITFSLSDNTNVVRFDEMKESERRSRKKLTDHLTTLRKMHNEMQTLREVKCMQEGWMEKQKLNVDLKKIPLKDLRVLVENEASKNVRNRTTSNIASKGNHVNAFDEVVSRVSRADTSRIMGDLASPQISSHYS